MSTQPGLGDFVSDVADFLHELVIDEGTIKSILDMLEDASATMPTSKNFAARLPTTFTGLEAGKAMGTHTNAAQEYLLGAVTEMMETVTLFRDGVVAFKKGNVTHDEFTADELSTIRHATERASVLNLNDGPQKGDES